MHRIDKLFPVLVFKPLTIALLVVYCGCSGDTQTSNNPAFSKGSIAFSVVWQDISAKSPHTEVSSQANGSDVCTDYSISTIAASVYDTLDASVTDPVEFEC